MTTLVTCWTSIPKIAQALRSSAVNQEQVRWLLSILAEADRGAAKILGTTAYLYFRIIKQMIMGRPFLYQTTDGNVYHISDTVVSIASWPPREAIVAFIDADSTSFAPMPFLIHPLIQLVLASPLRGTKQKWLKQLPSGGFVIKYVSALWTRSEFFVTGFVISWHVCGLH